MAQWSDLKVSSFAFWESFEGLMMKLKFSRPRAKMLRYLAFRAVWRLRGLVQWLFAPQLVLQLVIRHLLALVLMYGLYALASFIKKSLKHSVYGVVEQLGIWMGSGRFSRLRLLKRNMMNAKSFTEWRNFAFEADYLEGKQKWKDDPTSEHYDHQRIEVNLERLRELVESGDIESVMRYLRSRLLRNIGGIGNRELHTHLRAGTKSLVEEYMEEVVRALHLVANETHPRISNNRKLAFFNETRHAFGRSALLLSGGATLGLYHAGVIKALHENGLLPRVVSGASVGSIFAAYIGTRTDAELKDFTVPGKFQFAFFPSGKGAFWRRIKRILTQGVLMDIEILQECVRANVGDYTFAEAYARTGRVINIVVAPPNESKEMPALLNYLTAPDVLIWSAACASCAIPFVYKPVELMCKDIVSGEIVPYFSEGVKWWDGSMSQDLPMNKLSELFNVNHFIVSQVNPHVVPFVFASSEFSNHRENLFFNLTYTLGNEVKSVLLGWYDMVSTVVPVVKNFINIASQKYSGDITLYPAVELAEFFGILTNPTEERFFTCMRKAELYTFRQLSYVRNHCEIEFTLDECVRKIRGDMIMTEEIPLLEPSEEGHAAPSTYLASRIRSWSSEQFQLLNQSVEEQTKRASQMDYLRPKEKVQKVRIIAPNRSQSTALFKTSSE
eukprot:TRINITY_DN19485_c0_g1_i1.p1 TRINITY_DN19485_c0_g1~~TRINITY_DN19485_c0_g1_i1.p1  ORF type:complete len:670 (-),score=152.29 TRINITY_DN19485_c0_g1_i1:1680-3689(-)